MPPSTPSMGLDVSSRHGDIVLFIPEGFSGVMQLSSRKGTMQVLPALSARMKILPGSLFLRSLDSFWQHNRRYERSRPLYAPGWFLEEAWWNSARGFEALMHARPKILFYLCSMFDAISSNLCSTVLGQELLCTSICQSQVRAKSFKKGR
ncbi:hypothetical protein BDZ97DRAFT_705511 [Flammula alnicola]|nr:hypothetical protein BDZ97DRAFT_705511 [Flammula alnicola]